MSESEDGETSSGYYLFKILVVGVTGVGKTSMIQRLVYEIFKEEYKSTIGVEFAFLMMKLDDDTPIRVQLWDIGGQEQYARLLRAYYKMAYGAIVVGDINSKYFQTE
ncbi:small GTPase superfamily, Rab type, partial [Kipferlia bialata]|eukprot:g1261.t1